MVYFFVLLLVVATWCWWVKRTRQSVVDFKDSKKFWALVARIPNGAYHYFVGSDNWCVIHKGEKLAKEKRNWSGPYLVRVPNIGLVKVYVDPETIEKEQEYFYNHINR